MVLGESFKELAKMVLALLNIDKFSPQRKILKKKSTKALHLSTYGKFDPWKNIMEFTAQVPGVFSIYIIGPYKLSRLQA